MSIMSVCGTVHVSVGLSVRSHISKATRPNFTKFAIYKYTHVARGRGSVLL